jgi:hypothetical protein
MTLKLNPVAEPLVPVGARGVVAAGLIGLRTRYPRNLLAALSALCAAFALALVVPGEASAAPDDERHEVTATGVMPLAAPPVELGHDYYLRSRLSWGKCAEIPSWSKSNYKQADVWTCANQANVKWYVVFAGTYGALDTYYIKNSYSKKCLNVAGGSVRNGTKIIQYTCSSALNNRWRLVSHNGYYEIKNMNTNSFVNIAGGRASNGAKLVEWNTFGRTNQDFFFDLA